MINSKLTIYLLFYAFFTSSFSYLNSLASLCMPTDSRFFMFWHEFC